MVIHAIEICAGVGMLGEGVRAAFDFYGVGLRTVCYVEREAYAAAQLVGLMEAQCLDEAPVWSDLTTFDAGAWRGAVDCVIAGFPCQDLSVAGRRAGLDGARSGLFFDVLRVAHDCGARWLILENVAGIASAGASVVDEGAELEERAAARVLGELADSGWNAAWMHLSASEVGARHGRERWFCFAWRVGHPGLQHQQLQQRTDGAESQTAGYPVADASQQGLAQRIGGGCHNDAFQPASGSEPSGVHQIFPIFAPGPTDERWADIIRVRPDLAPATEPGVCGVVNGLAMVVDESRTHQLRAIGNGVVPLCAAAALVELMRRAT